MQPNTITLSVDHSNNGTPSNEEFQRHEEQINRTTYRGPDHSVASPNTLQLYRTLPKRSGSYLGSAKVSFKFTEAATVKNAEGLDIQAPRIAEVSFSVPVGDTAINELALRQRLIALLDSDPVMTPLMSYQEI